MTAQHGPEASEGLNEEPMLPPLARLYFYLTEGCNLACRHCWLAPPFDPDADSAAVLPVELFDKAIAEALPLGLTGVKLTGGEPLLHTHFAALVERVRRSGLALSVETNGTLMTAAIARQLASCDDVSVSVSLDGADRATHEQVRRVRGSFDKAVRAVRLLADVGLQPQIIFSVMRGNAAQVEAIVALAEELGAGSVKFNVIQPTALGADLRGEWEALAVGEYVALGRRVETDLASTTHLALYFDYPAAFRPLSVIARSDGGGRCGILGILGVLASGRYALCGIGEHIPELVFGRIGVEPLADIWRREPVLTTLRNGLPLQLGGVCADCLLSGRCLGSCIAQNFYRAGNLLAPYWFCEIADREGIFPQSRRRGEAAAKENGAA